MAVRTYHTGDRAGGIPVARRPIDLDEHRRERIEALVEVLIGMLDAADESDDREGAGTDDDCCAAHDDDPAWPGGHGQWLPGDPDDAEPSDDDEASAQPAMTPDSTRPTLPLPMMVLT